MNRRLAILLLVPALLLGCGGDDADEEPAAGDTATETEAPSGGQGDAAAGRAVFDEAGCGGCHVLSAAGSSGNVGPNLDESQPDFGLVVDRVTNGEGAMPSFSDRLSEQEIRDVAAFVSESAGG